MAEVRPLIFDTSEPSNIELPVGDNIAEHLFLPNLAGGQVVGSQGAGRILSVEDSGTVERIRVEEGGDAILALFSTTQGFGLMPMTELQRDAIGTPRTGLLVFNTDTGQVNQYNGSAWTVPGAGLTTLQGAYDNDPTGAQIVLDGVPNPVTVQASVAGQVFAAQDLGGNTILSVDADPDIVTVEGQLNVNDVFTNSAIQTSLVVSDTFTTGGGYLGGVLSSTGTVTYNNAFFIWATFAEGKAYEALVGPGFAAYTVMNSLPRIFSGSNDLVQILTLNDGGVHDRTASGTSVTPQHTTVSSAPQLRASALGAVATWTAGAKGLVFAPKWSTVALSTINMNTVCAVQQVPPGAALFQPQDGTENVANIFGVDFLAHTTTVSGDIAVIRNSMTSAANRWLLLNPGGANSDLGMGQLQEVGQIFQPADLAGRTIGAANDFQDGWAAGNFYFWQFNGSSDQLRFSNPSSDRFLFDTNGGNTVAEYNWNCLKSSHGAQTGAVGNQKFAWVGGPETITVAGEFSTRLFTYSGNDTINAALSLYATDTTNAGNPSLGTGSLTTNVVSNIGGNPGTASVNRVGLRIISDPSGGSGVNAALWITAGNTQLDGDLTHTGTNVGIFGATPVAQPTALGITAGFTAGVGTPANDDSTYTGNTGASAYTMGDVVRALKDLGALAA